MPNKLPHPTCGARASHEKNTALQQYQTAENFEIELK